MDSSDTCIKLLDEALACLVFVPFLQYPVVLVFWLLLYLIWTSVFSCLSFRFILISYAPLWLLLLGFESVSHMSSPSLEFLLPLLLFLLSWRDEQLLRDDLDLNLGRDPVGHLVWNLGLLDLFSGDLDLWYWSRLQASVCTDASYRSASPVTRTFVFCTRISSFSTAL